MPGVMICLQSFIHSIFTKSFRVLIMFVLTITTATVEIVYGIRAHSNSLIADGLYSFAEGLCLIGVLLVLRSAHNERHRRTNNTFGHERLELLFGLMQEVFLLSISLGVIVDAVNHLTNPIHVQDPLLMIVLGITGTIVGLLGIVMFWGYHHDLDIGEKISKRKKEDFLALAQQHAKSKYQATSHVREEEIVADPLITDPLPNESDGITNMEINLPSSQHQPTGLEEFTYGNVEIAESKIYATLHALCLHSFVVLLESMIVIISGLLIKFIPHHGPNGEEINAWLKYIDPLLTLVMVVIIAVRAIPAIYSISEILIENVPHGIDTHVLMQEIVSAIPKIKSIHSLHVWRATAKDVYATLHLVCEEDVPISTCTHTFGREIEQILKSYYIRYFTLQFEYRQPTNHSDQPDQYRCSYGLHRTRRGHEMDCSINKIVTGTSISIL